MKPKHQLSFSYLSDIVYKNNSLRTKIWYLFDFSRCYGNKNCHQNRMGIGRGSFWNTLERKAKAMNRYNQVPDLTQDTILESNFNTSKIDNTQDSQEVSTFPADDHKAARNRQDSITKTKMKQITNLRNAQ